jgi:sugar phosphate isomerase/epimerase
LTVRAAARAWIPIVQFGLSTHLFHDQRLAREHLDAIAVHRFSSIELFATKTHFDYHDPSAIEALASWLEQTHLTLHSVHAPIVEGYTDGVWGAPLSNAVSDAAARERALRETRAALDVARTVPFPFLIVHVGQPDAQSPPENDNQRDAARRSLDEIYDATSRCPGVQLAIEVIPNRLSSVETLVRFIDDLELEQAGLCLDFGHAFIMDDLVDVIESASGQMLTTHVHDNDGSNDTHLVPFEGRIDWSRALFATQKVGYEGVWMMELANTSTPAEVLRKARHACDRFRDILAS